MVSQPRHIGHNLPCCHNLNSGKGTYYIEQQIEILSELNRLTSRIKLPAFERHYYAIGIITISIF